MVGIVLVSHSEKIVEGVKELAMQMAPDAIVSTAGGTKDNRIGTDIDKISDAINDVYSEDGVLVLFDLGSAFMNTEMAIEFLDDDRKDRVIIVDTAIVEGGITAIIESSIGKSIQEIKESVEVMKLNKMP
ncbi:MAG: dihydroxyacetone kinase phosphoryl donor subunit DhaM [Clostridium sp.]|uniref:dihydroxyacetone kinase phosphoryl donor subunit DhaM n=1 Tax=Clostridium sp. TaxID=1506 RepID=UPI00303C1188